MKILCAFLPCHVHLIIMFDKDYKLCCSSYVNFSILLLLLFFLVYLNIFVTALLSDTLSVRNRVSCPYKSIGNVILKHKGGLYNPTTTHTTVLTWLQGCSLSVLIWVGWTHKATLAVQPFSDLLCVPICFILPVVPYLYQSTVYYRFSS
jgi:hypothetical protein